MWSDPSKRRLIVVGLVVLAVVAGGTAWWWNSRANQRHVESLVEMAFDYAEVEGPGATFNYGRRDYGPSGCDGPAGEGNWVGRQGAESRFAEEDVVDVLGGAERAADRYEADGWTVWRFLGQERRYVYVLRDDDRLSIFFSPRELTLTAYSGPCVPFQAWPPDPPLAAELVDRFVD